MGCGTLCLPLLIGACLQAAQFPIKTYTTADGLPRNFVTCFLQDSRGFLWVGTADGLARFDGRQFVTYDSERGLPLGRVFDLLESRSGFLWVATRRRLWRFPPGSSWPVYKPGDEKARLVLALLQDRSGTIWVGTDGGLFRFRESAGGNAAEAPKLEWVDLGPPALPGLNVNALFEDRRGALWIAAENGLYRRQPDGHVDPFVANDTVSSLAEDRHGRLWMGTWHGGVASLVPDPVPGRPFVEFGCGTAEGLASNRIHFLVRLSDGRLLASTGDNLEMSAAGARSRCAVQRFPGTIGDGLYQDRQGNLWFGGETGASRVALNGFVSYSQVDGLGDPAVRAIAEDRAGDMIVVSRQIQINRFDGRRFTSVEPNLPGANKYPDWGWGSYQTILQDRMGEWWVPTAVGLYRFPKVAHIAELAWTKPKAVYKKRDGLPGDSVFRLFEDSRGDLWVSTIYGAMDGLTRWERSTGRFIRQAVVGATPSLPAGPPTAFREDSSGALWVGFYGGGLARLRGGGWTFFRPEDGAPGGFVGAIHRDSQGKLWIAWSRGLTRVEEPGAERPRFATFTKAHGLSANGASCITEDEFGRIYVCSAGTLDRIDPRAFPGRASVKHYTAADGLPAGELSAAYRDRRGRLWFGTGHGLSSLVPEPVQPLQPVPVLITSMRINGVPHPLSEWGESAVTGVRLKSWQNHVELDFVAPSVAPGAPPRYQHRLEGVEADWSPPADQRSVHYATLSPGSYRFRVRSVSAEGVSSSGAVVEFRVSPPLWRRWWFETLALLAGCGLVYAGHRYRLQRVVDLERVRMRIATDLHDDLGANLSQIAILTEVARVQDGPGGEQLSRIANLARDLVDSTSDIVWAIRPQKELLSDLVQRMREFAGDALIARNIELRFQAPAAGPDVKLNADVRRQVFFIFKESINNILRHSGASTVTVEVAVEGNRLSLRTSDNGKGFDAAAGNSLKGNRHGLTGMRWRAATIGGSLDIVSGRGVTVSLSVPLRRSPLQKYVGGRQPGLP